MRYISAYRNAKGLRTILTLMQVLVLLVPVVSLLFVLFFIFSLGKSIPIPPQIWFSLLMMMAAGFFVFFLVRMMFRRLIALTIDVTADGLHHIAPGGEFTILWRDVTDARIVRYGKGQIALQIRTPDRRYNLSPVLVPDSPDSPHLKFTMKRYEWLYPDGRTEPYDLEHSHGYKIIQQYRSDLLTK